MQEPTNHFSPPWILAAGSATELRAKAADLRGRLDRSGRDEPAAIAAELAGADLGGSHRAVALGGAREALGEGLDALIADQPGAGAIKGRVREHRRVAFVFPPLRAEYEGMVVDLLEASSDFRASMAICEGALEPYAKWSLDDVLHGLPETPSLYRLDVSQHAVFATCVSLARLWERFGVRPDAVLGHSLGEVPAAALSGSLTVAEAARVTNTWGRSAMRFEHHGEMALIALPAAELARRIEPWEGSIWISALNGPASTSVSGRQEPVEALLAALAEDGIAGRLMGITAPGHSPLVRVIHQWFEEELQGLAPRPGTIPFYSGVVGRLVDQTQLDPLYWSSNLSGRVHFEPALRALLDDRHEILVEVGPRRVLGEILRETAADAEVDALIVGTVDQGDPTYLLRAMAELFVNGVEIDWSAVCGAEPEIPPAFWARRGPAAAASDGAGLAALLDGVPEIERELVALTLVRAEVAAEIEAADPAAIDPGRPFKDLGFDSPKAVNLRNRLIARTGLDLSTTVAFDYPTPRDVARKLLAQLDEDERPSSRADDPAAAIDALDLDGLIELSRRGRDGA